MNNSFNRQHLSKAHKPVKQHGTEVGSQSDKQSKARTANSKKSPSDDPVNSAETLRRNQKGYS